MNEKLENYLEELINEDILKYSLSDENVKYLHLKSPCRIDISESVTKRMKEEYQPEVEKGGILVAELSKIGDVTHVVVNDVIYIKNASETPHRSYRFDGNEEKDAYNKTIFNKEKTTFPIRFHTHPNNSKNPITNLMQYALQSNTSKGDQLASKFPIKIGEINLLMPRGVMVCSEFQGRMFLGFYNGMIAPFEFKEHRQEQVQKTFDDVADKIVEWAEKDNNLWWLVGGGLLLIMVSIKYNKVAIPLLMLLFGMLPTFINNNSKETKYFSQLDSGPATIIIP